MIMWLKHNYFKIFQNSTTTTIIHTNLYFIAGAEKYESHGPNPDHVVKITWQQKYFSFLSLCRLKITCNKKKVSGPLTFFL